MDMSKQKERHGGRLFCRCEKYKKGVQTSRRLWRLQKVVSRRVCPCAFQRGSLTLETSIVLPFLLCAVTAMLYVFAMTGFQAEKYRTLTQQAQSLAVTVGQGADVGDPYTRLYAYDQVTLPFAAFSFGSRSVVQRVVVRDWVGYTGESFSGDGEIFVYVTPKGEVYHRSRDCRYLNVSIQSIAAGQLDAARNWDGSRYTACVYCVKNGDGDSLFSDWRNALLPGVRWIMSVLWVFLHLLILSWEDMKDQMLSFWLLLELLLTGLLTALWNGREMVWFPGLFLLVVGKLSGERIGLGDGWLLLALGMWLPYEILMGILFLGLLAGAGYGILSGKKEIPLVPFFTVGFVLTVWGTII